MTTPTLREGQLYQRAWDVFGRGPQLTMINEECAELIKEVCKLKRHPDRSLLPMLDEIVDVAIMCEQFLTVHNLHVLFGHRKIAKLYRLRKKLDKLEGIEITDKKTLHTQFTEFTQSFQKKARKIYSGPVVDSILGKDKEKAVKKDEV